MSFNPYGSEMGTIVADIGSSSARIGYAGADQPQAHFQSAVGKEGDAPSSSSSSSSNKSSSSSSSTSGYQHDLSHFREGMSVEYPVKDGLITDWDAYESIWRHSLGQYTRADTRETPMIIAEKPYNPPENRLKLTELMFEKFNIPALFLAKDAVLACYACGRTTGLVVDCGGSGCTISPVQDGWVEMRGMNRSAIGGIYMDSYMAELLHKWRPSNPPMPFFRLERSLSSDTSRIITSKPRALQNVHNAFDTYMSLEMGREMKESISRVAESSLVEIESKLANIPLNQYELPDGTLIDVGLERFAASELVFDPSPLNLDNKYVRTLGIGCNREGALASSKEGLITAAADSIFRCDYELQAILVSNLIVTGGCTAPDNMPERIRIDLETMLKISVPTCRVKMTASAPNERAICPWLGASILGSLGSFQEMYISKREYDEFGPNIVEKKCP